MKWLTELEQTAKQKRQTRPKATKPLEVREICFTVRLPNGNDPGQIEIAHFVIDGDQLQLTNKDGEPIKDMTAALEPTSIYTRADRRLWAPSLINPGPPSKTRTTPCNDQRRPACRFRWRSAAEPKPGPMTPSGRKPGANTTLSIDDPDGVIDDHRCGPRADDVKWLTCH